MRPAAILLVLGLPLVLGVAPAQSKKPHDKAKEDGKKEAVRKEDHKEIQGWVMKKHPKDKLARKQCELYDLFVQHGVKTDKAKDYLKQAIENDLDLGQLKFRVRRVGETGLRKHMVEEAIESEIKLQLKKKKEAAAKEKEKKADPKKGSDKKKGRSK